MTKIDMIPIMWLTHHPENPRQDLGDLTELAESIRKNGVMQNLTIVPAQDEYGDDMYQMFWVVIGNRRLEAAKMAGLKELPCVLSDMDRTQQILTMMQENMQRTDLTPWEQAHGFQMMLDLGLSAKEIGERTGFSKTTVERRLRMAEMDRDLLKSACEATNTERQVTLRDFERLSRVDSIKERNALLKEVGNNAFEWRLKRALEVQQALKVRDYIKEILREQGIIKLKNDSDRYAPGYRKRYADSVDMSIWDPGMPLVPDHEGELFWWMDDIMLYFYSRTNIEPEPKKTKEEKESERQRKEFTAKMWEQYERDTETARKLRRDFAEQLTAGPKNAANMLLGMLTAAVLTDAMYCTPSLKRLCEAMNVKIKEGWSASHADILQGLKKLRMSDVPRVITAFFDCDRRTGYGIGRRTELPRYQQDELLDAYYDWLVSSGYRLSETEKQLKNGTHPSYQAEVKDEA